MKIPQDLTITEICLLKMANLITIQQAKNLIDEEPRNNFESGEFSEESDEQIGI